jgi:pimeloyl-ACP methyl ester carboxylesterase
MNNLLEEGDLLFLRHEGASMPILVRGNFESDVIILFLHGGAGGTAATHIEDFAGMVEEEYMIAYWDQRHAGSSQGSFDKEDLTIDLMAEDMQLVIELLKHKYGANKKVFAMGHSWGVILGTYYLISQENQLQGAIFSNGSHGSIPEYKGRMNYIKTYGQEMIDKGIKLPETLKKEGETFQTVEEVVQWAEENDPIKTWKQVKIQYELVNNGIKPYVDETHIQPYSDALGNVSNNELLFNSPYNMPIAMVNSLRTSQLINNQEAENSIQEFYDFTPQMDKITLPVSLIWGKYDHIIGLEVAEDYYQVITTPEEQKELVVLENSGHSGMYRENIKFSQTLIDFIEKHK